MTALTVVPDDAGADAILRDAEALRAAGTQAMSSGPRARTVAMVEETWGPVVPNLAALG